jgi:hypothetical protein
MFTIIPFLRSSFSQQRLVVAPLRSGKKYSKARVKAAEADIKEAEADEARAKARTIEDREKLRQDIILDMRLKLESQRLRKMHLDVNDRAMEQLLQAAAREILAIESIEVIDTDKDGTDTV